MKKQVRESSVAKSVRAIVVLNPQGKHVGTVQAHYSDAGICRVDVWAIPHGHNHFELRHQGRADGGGYDKFTAALAGTVIDGHRLFDHCERGVESNALLMEYNTKPIKWDGLVHKRFIDKAKAIGASFASVSKDTKGNPYYMACYMLPGLERLEKMGYTIINAL